MNATQIFARAATGVLSLSLLLLAPVIQSMAQDRIQDESYAIFVSQRNGAAELFLLDLTSRSVSQLTQTGRGHSSPAVSTDTGMLVFAARAGGSYELFRGEIGSAWRTRRPTIIGVSRLTVNPMDEMSPSLSRDGALMTFTSGHGIEIMSPFGSSRKIIVPSVPGNIDFGPVISPDGQQVAFVSNRGGGYDIWLYSRETGEIRRLTSGAAALGGLSWSGDSKHIAFTTAATSSKLTGIALAGAEDGSFRVLSDNNDSNPSLSAAGDRILFTSMRDGDSEIYLLDLRNDKIDRLTRSMGPDDSPVFLGRPVRPSRQSRH